MTRVGAATVLVLALAGCLESASEKREHELDKKLDEYYEIEWIKCVNELGLDRCRIIQETGFRQCQGYLYKKELGIPPCAEERFKDRMKEVGGEPVNEAEERGAPGLAQPEVEEPVQP